MAERPPLREERAPGNATLCVRKRQRVLPPGDSGAHGRGAVLVAAQSRSVKAARSGSSARSRVQPRACAPRDAERPRGSVPVWHGRAAGRGKLRPLVLDALLPHGCWWRVHTQGDDEALAVFRLDPLQLRLLGLVTVLALRGQGRRCRRVGGQHV